MKKHLLIILALCATTLAWGTTITKTATQLKEAYSWNNGAYYPSFDLDAVISVNANDGSDNGKFYENADRWRLFTNTDFRPFVISAKEGYVITSVTFTFSGNAGGMLFDATKTNQLTSGTAFVCTTPSVTFYSGYTGTGKESSIRTDITQFSVTYEKGIVETFDKLSDETKASTDDRKGDWFTWKITTGARHKTTDTLFNRTRSLWLSGSGDASMETKTTIEGGVKYVSFLWNKFNKTASPVKVSVTAGDITRELEKTVQTGDDYNQNHPDLVFGDNFGVKSNTKLKIANPQSTTALQIGPITIVPYIFYTTKAASIPLSQDGYRNTDLLDNTDGGTISYASSNTNVATVGSDGTITPYMTGTTTITASWDGVSTSYTLTVTAPTDATNSWTETFSQIEEHTSWDDSKTSNITYQKGDNDVFTWQFRNYRTYTSGDYKVGLRSGWTSPSTNNDYVAQQDVSEGGIKYISMVWVPNSNQAKNPTQVKFTMGDMTSGSILRTFEAAEGTLSTSNPITTTMRYNIKKNAQIRVQIPNSATESNEEYNSIKIKSITVTPYLLYTQKKVYKKKGDAAFTYKPSINNTEGEGGTISYASSNTNVATVASSGQVTIKGVGYAKITATWTNGGNTVTTFYRLYVQPNGRGYLERFSNAGENTYTPSSSPKSFSGDIKQKDHNTITWRAVSGSSITKSGSRALFGDGVNALKVAGNTVLGSNVSFYGGIKYITAFIGQVNDGSGKTISVDFGVGSTIGSNKMVTLNLGTSDKVAGSIPYYTSNSLPIDNSSRTDKQLIYINNTTSNPFYIDSLVIYPYIQYIKDSVIRKKSYPSAAEMTYDVANEDVLINNVESGDGTVTYSITAPATHKSTISGHIVDFSAVTEDETLTITADFVPSGKTNHIKTTFQLKVQVLNTYEPSITFMQTDATNTIRKNITDAAFTPGYTLRVNGADHTNDIDVTLTSSNPNVISVGENNQLTITGAGTAIITATAPENDTYDSRALNASFNVVVTGYEDDTKLIEDYSKVPATTAWVHSETPFTSAAYGTDWKINHFNTSNSGDVILGQKAVRLSKDATTLGEIKSDGTIEGGIKAVAFDWRINNNGKVKFGVTAGSTTKTAQYDDVIKGQVTHYEQYFGVKSNCNFQFLMNNYTTESFILGPISITPYIYYTTREVFLDIASTPKEIFDSKAVLIDNTGDEGEVTFSSANTNVATVDANGVITAVGSGETYVTATWSEGATTRIHVITAEKFDRIWNLILGKPDGSGDDNVIVTFNQEIIRDIDRTNNTITILGLGGETKTAVKIATNPASAVNTNWQTIVGSVSNTVIGKWTKNADYNYTFTIGNWSALTYLENGEVPPAPDEPLKSTTTTLNNGADITTTLAAAPATLPLSVTYDDVFVTKIPIEDPSCEFTSSDENVATIDENGQVTVVGIGTAELKAHFLETGKYAESEATINITVNVPEGEQSWTETFSSMATPTTYDITLTTIEGDNNVLKWKARNFQRSTTADMVNDQQGIRLNNKAKETYSNPGYVEYYTDNNVSSQEGGIKRVLFQWRIPGSSDNQKVVFYVKYKEGSETITRTLTYTGVAHGTVYDYAQNFNLKNNNKLTIAGSTDSDQPVIVGPITITPYLLYTTKFHKIDVANGESDTWTNEGLINNTDGGTIVYSIEDIEGEGVAEIAAASGQVTAKSNGKAKVTATWTPADAKSGEVVTTTYEVEVFMEKFAAELAFNSGEINAYVNETAISTPTLSNPHELTVKYSSSDENIAIVAGDGSVTLKGVAGDVIISATSDETDTYKEGNASYTIHVLKLTPEMTFTAPASVALDGAINESDINVVVTAGGQPVENPEIIFTSSDENVIKITNAGWKVIGIGTTTITANVAGTVTYESVSANVDIEVTNITPAAGTYWKESFSSLGNKSSYQGYTSNIAGDYGVTWTLRNFRHKTSDESDQVNGEYGVRLKYNASSDSKDAYIETSSLEGGVKRLQFKWKTPENSENPKFTVEFDGEVLGDTVKQEQAAADAGTVYDFGYNANIAKNAKFTIRVKDGTCVSIFGPLYITPYLFYTEKVVEKTYVVDGDNTVDASANLINNLEDGETVTYSLSAGAQASIDGSTITLANATEDVTVTATWGEVSTTFTLKVTKADDPVVEPDFVLENKTAGAYATICLPNKIDRVENATLYSINYGNTQEIEFVEADLEGDAAGMPYLVQVAADGNVNFYYGEGDAVDAPVSAEEAKGFVGSLQEEDQLVPSNGSAILVSGGQLHIAGEWCYLSKNHAYISTTYLPETATPSSAPRRTIRLYNPDAAPTNLNGLNGTVKPMKVLRDGQFYIICDTKTYNALGIEL